MTDVVVKSKETKDGVQFRLIRDGKFVFTHIPFNNYFYLKISDYLTHEEEYLQEFNWCTKKADAVGQFTKLTLSSNFMRNKVRKFWEARCKTFEADILANKRFLLDNKIKLNNTLIPYSFFDIETDDRLPLQKDDRGNVSPGNARVLSFAATDHLGKQVYYELNSETDADETALLTMIIKYFSNYGVISGWNSEKFDMPYIKGRCDALGVQYQILDYVNHLDYMDLFKKYDKKSRKSYSLNNISNEILKESKIDQKKGNGELYRTWLNDKEKLRIYNMEDSNLVYKINKKMMFIEVSMKRADFAGCHIRETVNNSGSGDYLLMRGYKEANIIMPSQPTREEYEARKGQGKIGGGYTTCFEPGFHEQVRIWDFKSEYPSAIQTWNIDPMTYVETIHNEKDAAAIDRNKYIVTPHDFEGTYHPARVFTKEEGVIPRVVRGIVEARDKIKYPMQKYAKHKLDGSDNPDYDEDKYKTLFLEQYALKTDANSIYGILAFPMSRYYSWELGDSVTTCARATLKACNKEVILWGCTVIGGDTDSSFVKLGPNNTIEEIDAKYVEFLQKWADSFGCINNKLVFEYEKTFDYMLFVAKKNYAFRIGNDITIKGMEAIKSDTNKLAGEMQRKYILDVMNLRYVEDDWRKEVGNLYNKVFNQEMTSAELRLVKSLSKMPQMYVGPTISKATGKPKIKADGTIQMKSIPAHVKLAERMIKQGKDLYPGSKMSYIVIKDKPILAVSPEEYEKGEGVFEYKHKKKGIIDFEWEGGYEANYYWMRILKPLIKVVHAYHRRLPDWDWNLTQSQINKIMKDKDEEEAEV